MEMTVQAHQARLMAHKVETEHYYEAMEKAEKCIRQRVEGKIALSAHSGERSCLITYFLYEEEVYKCVAKILEENGYKVEKLTHSTVPALVVQW